MIEVVGLRKRFGTALALDDVTVSFPAGTVTCVLGLNGAGKTTLLRSLAGLERPDDGQVRLAGRPLGANPNPMRAVGVHFNPAAMNPRHTANRHLSWLAAVGGIEPHQVDTVIAEAGLTGMQTRRIATLSTGTRQRLAIASALLGDPDAVILDEPVNGLDVPGIVWLRNLLRRLADTERTVVFASHLLSEVVLTADRLVVLSAGRVEAAGTLDEVVAVGCDPREYLEHRLLELAK